MSSSVYLILGTPGSGRRAIVRDLVENGLTAEAKVLVLIPEGEATDPAETRIAELPQATIRRWPWDDKELPEQDLTAATTVFFIADPHVSPVDQVEMIKPWVISHNATLARIFTVVDCQLAEKQPVLRQWFDACIHFSDVVFLNRREGVANKWLSDFVSHYKDQFFPCHFVQMKTKGALPTPLLWLDPTPRRVSQYFEDDYVDLSDIVIETGDDEKEDGEVVEPGEEDGIVPPEPYFVRLSSGRREKEVPSLDDYLPEK